MILINTETQRYRVFMTVQRVMNDNLCVSVPLC